MAPMIATAEKAESFASARTFAWALTAGG